MRLSLSFLALYRHSSSTGIMNTKPRKSFSRFSPPKLSLPRRELFTGLRDAQEIEDETRADFARYDVARRYARI